MKPVHNRKEEGQSFVIIALLMVALLGFLGLLVDGGRVFAARRQSQNAADGAAFAGARALTTRTGNGPGDDSNILGVVQKYALANGAGDIADVQAYYMRSASEWGPIGGGSIPGDATGVRVFVKLHIQPFLINILGGNGPVDAAARATVQTGVPSEIGNVMPVVVKQADYTYGREYTLVGDKLGPGNIGYWAGDWACSNSDIRLADHFRLPDDPAFMPSGEVIADPADARPAHSLVCGVPGTNVGNVTDIINQWLSLPELQRHWVVPIFDYCEGKEAHDGKCNGTNMTYHIVAFAEFVPTKNTLPDAVTGKFIKYTVPSHIAAPGSCNTDGANMCGMTLTE